MARRNNKKDAVVSVALEFYYDGKNMEEALQKANKHTKENAKRLSREELEIYKAAAEARLTYQKQFNASMTREELAEYEEMQRKKLQSLKKLNKLEEKELKNLNSKHLAEVQKNLSKITKINTKELIKRSKLEMEAARKAAQEQFNQQTKVLKGITQTTMKELLKRANDAKALEKKIAQDKINEQTKVLKHITRLNIREVMARAKQEQSMSKKIAAGRLTDTKRVLSNIKALEIKHAREVSNLQTGSRSTIGGSSGRSFSTALNTISMYFSAAAVITTLISGTQALIQYTIEYEAALADLQAKAGYTSKEMEGLKENIEATARESKFSTIEITKGATALGKLGFTAEETNVSLKAVVDTAAATGESLETTAETIGKVIRAYDLSAKSAGLMSDRLVKAFNNSALNLEKFGTAFSYVGGAAAETGTDFNDLIAAMQLLSDRGITASKIGTGLRKILLKLGGQGESLSEILDKLSGDMVSMAAISKEIGQIGSNQLAILVNNYDLYIEKVKEAEKVNREASEAAAIQTKTFGSQMAILWNNIKNMASYAGSAFDKARDIGGEILGTVETINAAFDNGASATQRYLAINKEVLEEYHKIREKAIAKGEKKTHEEILKELGISTPNEIQSAIQFFRKGTSNIGIALKQNVEEFMKPLADDAEKAAEAQREKFWNILQRFNHQNQTATSNLLIEYIIGYSDKETFEANLRELNIAESAIKVLQEESAKIQSESEWGQYPDALGGFITNKNNTEREKVKARIGDELTTIRQIWKEELDTNKKELEEMFSNSSVDTNSLLNLNTTINNADWVHSDRADVESRVKKMREIVREICSSGDAEAIKLLGITCKEKKGRSRRPKPDLEYFQKSIKDEEAYLKKMSNLRREYGETDDPQEQRRIKNDLIKVEEDYRSGLNLKLEEYLKDAHKLQERFAKKYPNEKNIYDPFVLNAEKQKSSSSVALTKSLNSIEKLKLSFYRRDETEFQKYRLKLSEINLEYAEKESNLDVNAKDFRQQQTMLMNKKRKIMTDISKEYYESQLILAREGVQKLADAAESEADFKQLEKAKQVLMKMESDYNNFLAQNQERGIKNLKLATEEKIRITLEGAEMLAEIYDMIAQSRLAQMQREADAELEILRNKNEEEGKIRNSALKAGIISQEAATRAEEKANKKRIDKENEINKKMFEARKKAEMSSILINGMIQAAQAYITAIAAYAANPPLGQIIGAMSSGLIMAKTGIAVSLKGKEKFVPAKYAEGGIVKGRSHASGGVPFTVQGHSGYEMEGGEYIVNKEATKKFFNELEAINGKTKPNKTMFKTGGKVTPQELTDSIDYSSAILEALNRPVRAYVTNQDLARSESERRALTVKTNY